MVVQSDSEKGAYVGFKSKTNLALKVLRVNGYYLYSYLNGKYWIPQTQC